MNVNSPRTLPEAPKDQQPQQADTVPEIAAVFKAPVPPSPHDFVIAGPSGLLLEVVYLDFLDLLTAYAATKSLDYPVFVSQWRERELSHIHFACRDKAARRDFMEAIYDTLLDYLKPDIPFNVRTGALFSLYLIYFTQPKSFARQPIPLTRRMLFMLDTIYQHATDLKASDLVFTMHKLWTADAFQFVAQHNRTGKKLDDTEEVNLFVEKSLISMEKKINEKSLIPVEPIANELYQAAKSYHAAKLGLTSVGLAKKASEVMMAHLQTLKPADMDIAKAQPNLRRSDAPDMTSEDTSLTNRGSSKDDDNGEARTGEGDMEMAEMSSTAPHSGMGSAEGPSTKRRRDSNLPDLTKRVPLPSIFPVSMLESSQGLISLEIEQRMRTHLYNRVHRVEYASAGGLQQNDNKFVEPPPEAPQLELKKRRRKKNSSIYQQLIALHRDTDGNTANQGPPPEPGEDTVVTPDPHEGDGA
ncbi:Small nuclear RNA activating complex, polypeptide 1, 43kDa [Podila clonocystis]|nr:Small nuclear RNA activating complex, polypeptide 1, 43kDa [Podila clonocystis]